MVKRNNQSLNRRYTNALDGAISVVPEQDIESSWMSDNGLLGRFVMLPEARTIQIRL